MTVLSNGDPEGHRVSFFEDPVQSKTLQEFCWWINPPTNKFRWKWDANFGLSKIRPGCSADVSQMNLTTGRSNDRDGAVFGCEGGNLCDVGKHEKHISFWWFCCWTWQTRYLIDNYWQLVLWVTTNTAVFQCLAQVATRMALGGNLDRQRGGSDGRFHQKTTEPSMFGHAFGNPLKTRNMLLADFLGQFACDMFTCSCWLMLDLMFVRHTCGLFMPRVLWALFSYSFFVVAWGPLARHHESWEEVVWTLKEILEKSLQPRQQ